MRRPARSTGDRWTALGAWAVCGLTLAASLLLLPIGLLALPVPIAIGVALVSRDRAWPEVLGLALGVSAFLGYVTYRNRDSVPCEGLPTSGVSRPGQAEFRCGGTAPEPWLLAALVLVSLTAAAYALALLAEERNRV